MAKARRLLTNFSKGELSPRLEGRPDVAAYFEGCRTLENFDILRQGGVSRRIGTRFVAEVQDNAVPSVLIPFEADINNSYVVEFANGFLRFYKDKAQLQQGGGEPVQVSSPYDTAKLPFVHFTQSVDVLFLFHRQVAQRKLNRISDTEWTISTTVHRPPPTFENDVVAAGTNATLTPGATTGNGVTFTASAAAFLQGDIGRLIVSGAARALIKTVGPSAGSVGLQTVVTADILEDFPNTDPIAAANWRLRLSPQADLDPNIKAPVNAIVTLTASKECFRGSDVGKYIIIYGGIVKILSVPNTTTVVAEIFKTMDAVEDADPNAASAGAWTLEEESWNVTNGFPGTGEFYQGRLAQAGTLLQPTTFWLSETDNYDSYGVGIMANSAIQYTMATRQLNRIEWLADNQDLFIGTAGSEHILPQPRDGEPLGGDKIPLVLRINHYGSAPIQPVLFGGRAIFVDRMRRLILVISYDFQADRHDIVELTAVAEHITESGIKIGAIAAARRPDPRIYFVREDGQLIALTFFINERVVGFSRYVTDGAFESVAVIPQSGVRPDQVWVTVRRTINGVTKRYVEVLDEDAVAGRPWTSLQTDSAKIYTLGAPTTVLTGLSHLEGKQVDVISDNSYVGRYTVSGGQITLLEAAESHVEVGLPYASILETMRPAIEGTVIEGLPRSWQRLWARVLDSVGGILNGQDMLYPPDNLNNKQPFTGDIKVSGYENPTTDGRVRIEQRQPYPLTVLGLFGDLDIGDHG